MNRYERERNFVAPLVESRREPVNIGVDAMLDGEVIHVGQPLSAHHGAQEQTSGIDRSKSLVLRLVPFSIIWFVLSVSVAWVAGMGAAWSLIVFSGLTAITYGLMDKREYMYSRNGLERHKVDTLADLKETELAQAHELRKMVVESQIEMWRAQYGAGDAQIRDGGGAVTGRIAGPTAEDSIE